MLAFRKGCWGSCNKMAPEKLSRNEQRRELLVLPGRCPHLFLVFMDKTQVHIFSLILCFWFLLLLLLFFLSLLRVEGTSKTHGIIKYVQLYQLPALVHLHTYLIFIPGLYFLNFSVSTVTFQVLLSLSSLQQPNVIKMRYSWVVSL